MKRKSLCLMLMVIALALSVAGCGCFQQAMRGEKAAPGAADQQKAAAGDKKQIVVKKDDGQAAAIASALQDIFFDYDRYAIRPADAEKLKKGYAAVKTNAAKVRVEGNCDERGTVEYNLALGQKRADAAKAYLVNLGMDGKRLETVSYGKEKPVDAGHNEAAWSKNRRVHFTPLQ